MKLKYKLIEWLWSMAGKLAFIVVVAFLMQSSWERRLLPDPTFQNVQLVCTSSATGITTIEANVNVKFLRNGGVWITQSAGSDPEDHTLQFWMFGYADSCDVRPANAKTMGFSSSSEWLKKYDPTGCVSEFCQH